MQRDDQPTILASIEAARRALDEAEKTKHDADHAAAQAKTERDRRRRILNDRIITAALNQIPQKLIVDRSGRTREFIRRTVGLRTDPTEVYFGGVRTPDEGGPRNWREKSLAGWLDRARSEGMEPLLLDHPVKDDQVGWILIYDTVYELIHDGGTVSAVADPFADPKDYRIKDEEQ
jgi:hypothetical protein